MHLDNSIALSFSISMGRKVYFDDQVPSTKMASDRLTSVENLQLYLFFSLITDSDWKFTTSGKVWPCRSDAWGGPSVCPMLTKCWVAMVCRETGRDRSLLWGREILHRVMPNGRPRYSNLWVGWGSNPTLAVSAGYWLRELGRTRPLPRHCPGTLQHVFPENGEEVGTRTSAFNEDPGYNAQT